MVIQRGQIYWVDLGPPEGSEPGQLRPVVVVQADAYNQSGLATVIAAVITSRQRLAVMPGNVFLPKEATGLPKDSVVNVTAVVTISKADCQQVVGAIPAHLMQNVDRGMRLVLNL